MTRKILLISAAAVILGAGLAYFYGGHTVPAGQPELFDLTPQTLSALETSFNDAKSEVRVLLLLSPT